MSLFERGSVTPEDLSNAGFTGVEIARLKAFRARLHSNFDPPVDAPGELPTAVEESSTELKTHYMHDEFPSLQLDMAVFFGQMDLYLAFDKNARDIKNKDIDIPYGRQRIYGDNYTSSIAQSLNSPSSTAKVSVKHIASETNSISYEYIERVILNYDGTFNYTKEYVNDAPGNPSEYYAVHPLSTEPIPVEIVERSQKLLKSYISLFKTTSPEEAETAEVGD